MTSIELFQLVNSSSIEFRIDLVYHLHIDATNSAQPQIIVALHIISAVIIANNSF